MNLLFNESRPDFQRGEVLLINKPLEWTSFDVVNKVRNLIRKHTDAGKIKVGHAGTLDPLAEGLLILCTGRATKKIHEFTGLDKEYEGTLCLGAITPSLDRETPVTETFDISGITEKGIREAAVKFTGTFEQIPPLYSAVNIDGKRAYSYARKNIEKRLAPREVTVHSFDITGIEMPYVRFRIVCSKGTYIRSIAADLGKYLGAGAYLKQLTRTAIGTYRLSEALSPEEFEKKLISGDQRINNS